MPRCFHLKWLIPIAAVLGVVSALIYSAVFSGNRRELSRFDPTRPFQLDFGRGSGMHGLATISIEPGGRTHLCRPKRTGEWERTVLTLATDQLASVAKAIARYQLVNLEKAYDGGVHDGTQWVLWVRQAGRQKTVYFDNKFPSSIRRFADELDHILAVAGVEKLEWYGFSGQTTHDDDLWNALWQSK